MPPPKMVPTALGYMLCSSLLMVLNKLALQTFPYPSTLMASQFAASAITVKLIDLTRISDQRIKPLSLQTIKNFWLVPFVYELCIFANIQLLHVTTIETTIVVRTLVPIVTSLADYLFMGRMLPNQRSAGGLALVVLGAWGYRVSRLASASGGADDAAMWALLYVALLSFEMVYVKHVMSELKLSTLSLVYYNNALALAFWPPLLLVGSEYQRLGSALGAIQQPYTLAVTLLSCVLGLGISFTGFGLRGLVTATTFTVVGVMNKIISVLCAIAIFGNTVNRAGLISLLLCIVGGTLYRQSPPREPSRGAASGQVAQVVLKLVSDDEVFPSGAEGKSDDAMKAIQIDGGAGYKRPGR